MSVQKLKTVLDAVFERDLSVQQIQRIASAFYTPQEGETNADAANIVLTKIRRRIIEVVKVKEGEEAAEAARSNARDGVDSEFNTKRGGTGR